MRWAPAVLFSALFLTSLGVSGAAALAAPSGARHSPFAGKGFHHGGHGVHRGRFHEVKPSFPHRHGFRHKHFPKHPHHRFHHHGFAAPFWPYLDSVGSTAPIIIEQPSPAPPAALIGIPSLADLPTSTGIRSGPVGSPTFYVIDGRHSARSGAKIVTLDQSGAGAEARRDGQPAEANDGGPRIIHLQVPVGR